MAPRPQLAHVTVHDEFSCNLAMADWKTRSQHGKNDVLSTTLTKVFKNAPNVAYVQTNDIFCVHVTYMLWQFR